MWIIILTLVWIVCGFLAYGLLKNEWRRFYIERKTIGYKRLDEILCILCAFGGPAGLLTHFMLCEYKSELCYVMPKELCDPRG